MILKVTRWATAVMGVVAAGMLVSIYACGTASGPNKFQGWSCLGLCVMVFLSISMQLRKQNKK